MKIYEMIQITETEGFFTSVDKEKVYWTINPDKNAIMVPSRDYCKRYDTLYTIEHDMDKMALDYILEIMYKKMSYEDITTLCNSNATLKEFLTAYLSGEKIKSELEEIKKRAKAAEDNSGAALALSFFK